MQSRALKVQRERSSQVCLLWVVLVVPLQYLRVLFVKRRI